METHQDAGDDLLPLCRAVATSKGWKWTKGMRIIEGWGFGESATDRIDCSGSMVDDVLLGRPFSDKHMQTVRGAAPDLSHDGTIDLAIEILRDLWQHDAVRVIESGNGWAIITRSGQLWARSKPEAILMGFESIPWNDKDGGRWKVK